MTTYLITLGEIRMGRKRGIDRNYSMLHITDVMFPITRGYTKREKELIKEWLKHNKPKVYGPGKGVWDGY